MQTADPDNLFRAEADLAVVDARKKKAERTKDIGWPIDTPGKTLAAQIRGGELWVAQSDAAIRRIELESGSLLRVYKGHAGPVTTLAFLENESDASSPYLVTGSWDKTVKIWNTRDKSLISSTEAHSDFVKCVFTVPKLKLLISSGSDRVVRFWDVSSIQPGTPLKLLGIISAHTRPVQSLAAEVYSENAATLITADSMGVIKVWDLERTYGETPSCRETLKEDWSYHRTGVSDMHYGHGQLWTASSDETVVLRAFTPSPTASTPSNTAKPVPPIAHPRPVRVLLPLGLTDLGEPYLLTANGDTIRVYDVSTPGEPELLSEADAHWHDVTALRLWVRKTKGEDGRTQVEPWIVSASLDGTVRRWRLADLINPPTDSVKPATKPIEKKPDDLFTLTAEEEAELADLMEDD